MDEKNYYDLKQEVAVNADRMSRMEKTIERIALSSEKTAESVTKSESINRFIGVVIGIVIPFILACGGYFINSYDKTNKEQYDLIRQNTDQIVFLDKRITVIENERIKK